ncbi:MAG: hypothetical protein NTY19_20110 [Planctomycetota bacterium]|nr:hypothetical protein [Planctomycetota bacterium]
MRLTNSAATAAEYTDVARISTGTKARRTDSLLAVSRFEFRRVILQAHADPAVEFGGGAAMSTITLEEAQAVSGMDDELSPTM